MSITHLISAFLGLALCVADASAAQSSTQPGGTQAGPQSIGTTGGQANMPLQRGVYADSALLTGPLGTRAPTGVATVEGRTVRITVTGDQPGSSRAWYVHRGSCARDEGLVGTPRMYSPLVIDAGGTGSGSVTLDAPFVAGGAYFVVVHSSATDPKSDVMACGSLTKGAMRMGQSSAQSMAHTPMHNVPMSNMPTTNMPAMDHSATSMPGMGSANMMGRSIPDSMSMLVTSIYSRMMADPVIRERAMTDPVLRSLLARVPTTFQPAAASGAAMSHDGMNMSGMTMSTSTAPAKHAAPPRTSKSASRPAAKSSSPKSISTPASKPAQKGNAKTAPRPAAKPAPKNPMPPMPGMDHSNMPGMNKP